MEEKRELQMKPTLRKEEIHSEQHISKHWTHVGLEPLPLAFSVS